MVADPERKQDEGFFPFEGFLPFVAQERPSLLESIRRAIFGAPDDKSVSRQKNSEITNNTVDTIPVSLASTIHVNDIYCPKRDEIASVIKFTKTIDLNLSGFNQLIVAAGRMPLSEALGATLSAINSEMDNLSRWNREIAKLGREIGQDSGLRKGGGGSGGGGSGNGGGYSGGSGGGNSGNRSLIEELWKAILRLANRLQEVAEVLIEAIPHAVAKAWHSFWSGWGQEAARWSFRAILIFLGIPTEDFELFE